MKLWYVPKYYSKEFCKMIDSNAPYDAKISRLDIETPPLMNGHKLGLK